MKRTLSRSQPGALSGLPHPWVWWRAPSLHFLLLGGLLFAGRLIGSLSPDTDRPPVYLSEARLDSIREEFQDRWGQPPSPTQLEHQIALAVDDEILEAEARRLGLAEGDLAIQRRLIDKMRSVAADPFAPEEDLVEDALTLGFDRDVVISRLLRQKMRVLLEQDSTAKRPSDLELQEWMKRHEEDFQQPALVDFVQIFVSRRLHGSRLAERAERVAEQIQRQQLPPEEARALSDPFPLSDQWSGRTENEIAQRLGSDFASQVLNLPLATWSAPLASRYGLHLVWVQEKKPAAPLPLDAVRPQILRRYEAERAAQRLGTALEKLREQYVVHIADIPSSSPLAGNFREMSP